MTSALILIDLQADFASPDGAMAREGHDMATVPAAIARCQALADAARAAGMAVIFVQLAGDTLCIPGTPGAAQVGPQPEATDILITKSRFSAFAHTGLAARLNAQEIDTLVLAGLTTECCVASTAWSAFEEGFCLTIAADACAAYEEGLHRQTLRALALSGATVTDTAQILAHWKTH